MANLWKRIFGGGNTSYRETIDPSIDRGNVLFCAPQDSRLYLSGCSRERVAAKAEWCRQNFGIVQEFGRGVARHSVGRGIGAQFNTTSAEWNQAAGLALEHYLMTPSQCDLTARRNGYEQQLWLAEQLVIIGESFSAFVANPAFPSPKGDAMDACPSFFNIAPSDVRTPYSALQVPIHDGVELGSFGETVRYWCRMWGNDEFTAYDAKDVAHLFEAHGAHQSRGVSPLAPAINNLVDIHELKRLETRTAKAQRMVALILKGVKGKKTRGAMGALSSAGTGNGDSGSTAADTASIEKIYGGAGAAIARLGEDGGVELLESKNPSPLVREYITDLLLRDAASAIGVPVELFWNPEKLGGANARGIYARADQTFQLIADKIIYRFFEPLIVRFISWRVKSGLLAEPPGGLDGNWRDSITYRRPRRITLDNGRDSAARIADLDHGLANLRGLYDEQGEDWLPQTRQWIGEFAIFKAECVAAGLSEKEIEMMLARWRPLPPGSVTSSPQKPDPKPSEDPATDKPEEENAAA